MLTKNQVATMALARMGSSQTVVNLDTDNSTPAKILRNFYQSSLETILEHYPWNIATGYKALALVAEKPVNSWGYSYRVPNDCQIIRRIGQDGLFYNVDEYEDEKAKWIHVFDAAGGLIYTNLKDAEIQYTVALDGEGPFQNHFGRAFAAQLAIDAAPAIITNNFSKVKKVFMEEAMAEIHKQIAVDISRQPLPETSDSPFVRARL